MLHDIVCAILLGIVEGLTEFLPVSSTGHLILVGQYLRFHSANQTTFDIAIQLGAIFAVVLVYKDYFKTLLQNPSPSNKALQNILWGFLPVMFVGFLAHGFIKKHLFSPHTVAYGLAAGALLMAWGEKKTAHKASVHSIASITWAQALTVGLFQCLSLWPGMSRSGSTLAGGLLCGLHRTAAAPFSFVLSVPVMLAAVTYDLYSSWHLLTPHDAVIIGVGMLVAFAVGYACITLFLRFIKHATLMPFVWYRLALALCVYAFGI